MGLDALDVYEKIMEEIKSKARWGESELEYPIGGNFYFFLWVWPVATNHFKIIRERLIENGFKVKLKTYFHAPKNCYMIISWS